MLGEIPKREAYMTEFLYRYTDYTVSIGTDEFGESLGGSRVEVGLYKYKVLKWTPKGAWISLYEIIPHDRKFVLLTARKKFACKTIEEAKESFVARKKAQIRILKANIAEEALLKV